MSEEINEKVIDEEHKTLTVFGPETEFDGVLEFSDDLIITGKFNGRIKATGNLEISKDSICTVEKMSARSIVISGSVTGNIEASERVEICSGGSVIGDIVTARLRIENNVNFEGQITMLDKIPEENLFASASSEYKQAMVLRTDIIE
ncbi:MAG: polymer-forming cytoskeletal protein [Treponema sp.]|nr:polymer-forming cytoskeletal protein [Treponema sp.]